MLRKDAKHSRITLPDGGAPVKLSSPTTRLTHHQPGFFVLPSTRRSTLRIKNPAIAGPEEFTLDSNALDPHPACR